MLGRLSFPSFCNEVHDALDLLLEGVGDGDAVAGHGGRPFVTNIMLRLHVGKDGVDMPLSSAYCMLVGPLDFLIACPTLEGLTATRLSSDIMPVNL